MDDINKRRHVPIPLESAWKTKWWANRQFTFLLSVAEVNAGMARARAKKQSAEPVLDFRRALAKLMLENKLNAYGEAPNSPIRPRRVSNTPHVLKKRERNEGKYDPERRAFKRVGQYISPALALGAARIHGTIVHVILRLICARHALGRIGWSIVDRVI